MEIWKAIEGFEGVAEVSNQGRIRTLDRQVQVEANNQYGVLGQFEHEIKREKRK